MRITTEISGTASASLVWARYVRPALWPTWSPQIRAVDCSDEVLRTGSVGVVHAILYVDVPFEVTEVDEQNRSWSWIARLPWGVRLRLRHTVQAEGDGVRTRLHLSGPLPVLLAYLPFARLALLRLVRPVRETQ
ncbi:MAG: SRPBCC family protein [Nakamurella sp.]